MASRAGGWQGCAKAADGGAARRACRHPSLRAVCEQRRWPGSLNAPLAPAAAGAHSRGAGRSRFPHAAGAKQAGGAAEGVLHPRAFALLLPSTGAGLRQFLLEQAAVRPTQRRPSRLTARRHTGARSHGGGQRSRLGWESSLHPSAPARDRRLPPLCIDRRCSSKAGPRRRGCNCSRSRRCPSTWRLSERSVGPRKAATRPDAAAGE